MSSVALVEGASLVGAGSKAGKWAGAGVDSGVGAARSMRVRSTLGGERLLLTPLPFPVPLPLPLPFATGLELGLAC